MDRGLKTLTVITENVFIDAFKIAVGLPVGIALREIRLLFSLRTVMTRKSFKIFPIKQEKQYN